MVVGVTAVVSSVVGWRLRRRVFIAISFPTARGFGIQRQHQSPVDPGVLGRGETTIQRCRRRSRSPLPTGQCPGGRREGRCWSLKETKNRRSARATTNKGTFPASGQEPSTCGSIQVGAVSGVSALRFIARRGEERTRRTQGKRLAFPGRLFVEIIPLMSSWPPVLAPVRTRRPNPFGGLRLEGLSLLYPACRCIVKRRFRDIKIYYRKVRLHLRLSRQGPRAPCRAV
jgi:hypothetical protein